MSLTSFSWIDLPISGFTLFNCPLLPVLIVGSNFGGSLVINSDLT